MMIKDSRKFGKNNKTPSLRDLMLGKKVVKSLPENFFEKVLDLELRIKREFNMNLLQELINYYSTAIEYYESKEDPKFKDYQNRLNSLLAQPDILKKMTDMSKAKSTPVTHDYLKNIKKEQEKKSIIAKVTHKNNTNSKLNNEKKVQNIISGIKDNNKIDSMVNKDMASQDDNFKKRLEQRKQKKLLSTSDCTDVIEAMKNKRGINRNMNMSQIIVPNNANKENAENFNIRDMIDGDDKFDIGDNSFEKMENNNIISNQLTNNLDVSGIENVNNSRYEKPKMSRIFNKGENTRGGLFSPNESYVMDNTVNTSTTKTNGPKHKQLINNINSSIDNFLESYNNSFMDQFISKYNEEVNELMEEKFSKKFVIFKNYHSQISEMEMMMRDDDGHRENIQVIIENLEEDKDQEIADLDKEYNKIISEKLQKIKTEAREKSQGISIVEEKFKMDMLGTLNNIIYNKK